MKQEAGEGVITVDVIVRYAGSQTLSDMMRVCQMTRNDGGVGVGIYVCLFKICVRIVLTDFSGVEPKANRRKGLQPSFH